MRRELKLRIEANANIDSDFVLPILDVNVDHDTPYLVSEFCSGGNLRGLMDRQALSPQVALKLFHQACLGLKAAHDNGLIHGDLKPENLLLTGRGNLKLADLGFSQLAQSETLAKQRAYVGYSSLGYLAPEMFRQDRHYTVSSDIYSMGIVLYELLVGRLPGRRSPLPSKVVDGLPEGVDDLFDRMAADDQDARIRSMDEVLSSLTTLMNLDGDLETVTVFLKAPFELPETFDLSMPVVDDEEALDGTPMHDDIDEPDEADDSPGLETINSDQPVNALRTELEANALDIEETQAALSSQDQGESPGVDAVEGMLNPPTEVALTGNESEPVDSRSQTAVHGADSTSMLDSIIDEPT